MITEVVIPYAPRRLQRELHTQADAHRFGAIVCHRRFGKTVWAVNHLQRAALTCRKPRPRFAHIFPTFRQGKAVGWDYAKHYAGPIPGMQVNESELRIDYPNGGQYRIFGADNPDSLRGHYFDGCIPDEYGLMAPRLFGEVLRPALSDRNGWCYFLGTPNGQNQFYESVQTARAAMAKVANPEGVTADELKEARQWFFAEYKARDTGILSAEELASARQSMTADQYAQEYECSFEASVQGAIYAREIIAARQEGRITRVPYEPELPVDTAWDLGVGDSTAIWFSQTLYTGEVRLIDYYENSGQGLQHYANVLTSKGYSYGQHVAPHDIEVRELTTGISRIQAARGFGIYFQVAPKLSLEDGINAARMVLPKCWFDAERCQQGLEALQGYRWDYNTRIHEHKAIPVHDWASHGADGFRMLAVTHATPKRPNAQRELAKAQKDRDPDDARWGKNIRWQGNAQRRGGF